MFFLWFVWSCLNIPVWVNFHFPRYTAVINLENGPLISAIEFYLNWFDTINWSTELFPQYYDSYLSENNHRATNCKQLSITIIAHTLKDSLTNQFMFSQKLLSHFMKCLLEQWFDNQAFSCNLQVSDFKKVVFDLELSVLSLCPWLCAIYHDFLKAGKSKLV